MSKKRNVSRGAASRQAGPGDTVEPSVGVIEAELAALDRLNVVAVVVDRLGTIVESTRAFFVLTAQSTETLRGRLLPDLAVTSDRERLLRVLGEVANDRKSRRIDTTMRAGTGERRVVWSCSPAHVRGDGILVWGVDVTAPAAEALVSNDAGQREELVAREREVSAIYTNVPGILFYVAVEPDGGFRFLAMSDGGLAAMGLSREQVIGARVADVIPLPSCDMVLNRYREAIRSGKTVRWEEISVYPAGQRHGEVAVTPLYDANGVATHLIGIVHDVTEVRESHARIRELAERLAMVREDERRAVAVTLHERVAQELYAAQLSLKALERKSGLSGITEIAKELSRVIDQSIAEVRDLTDQLYPTSLVYLPLSEALEHLARQVGKVSGVQVVVEQQPEFPELKAESRTLFFRAAQEALANVARHAAASNVTISLEADSERISMVVADDGKGVAAGDLRKPGSLGLLGIRERFAAAGGGLRVERSSPRGTWLTVFLPSRASQAGVAPPIPSARSRKVDGDNSPTSAGR